MNVGLSNLATLKAWLLPSGLLTGTDYDAQVAAIGKGIAAQMEKSCSRLFQRTVGDTFECSGDRAHVSLPRYPVEAVTTVELRTDMTAGFVAQTGAILSDSLKAGLIFFGCNIATPLDRLRITYTGGYFFETLEPADMGYPTATPSGSYALPNDLLLAWKLQCEHVWGQRDKLGLAVGDKPTATPPLAQIQLLPAVEATLSNYRRHSLGV